MTNTSTLAIFGATGGTGRALVATALQRGYHVRALCRPGSAIAEGAPNLEVLRGELLLADDVARTIAGCDAVCCVFGPRPGKSQPFCAAATRTIVEAMQSQRIQRLLCQTGAMIGDWDGNRTWPMRLMVAMFRRGDPATAADRQEQEAVVQASGLVWTMVKPPRLTDEPGGAVRLAGADLRVGLGSSLGRAALAGFILDEIASPRFIRAAVFVSG